jgi:hypothetical protein
MKEKDDVTSTIAAAALNPAEVMFARTREPKL